MPLHKNFLSIFWDSNLNILCQFEAEPNITDAYIEKKKNSVAKNVWIAKSEI